MPGKYHVLWAETAQRDLESLIDFIAADNPGNAIEIFNKIRAKALTLNTLPEKGRIVPELEEQGISLYRELILSPWRVIYRISGKSVYVLAVIDSRRNLEDILLARFIEG